MRCRLLAYAGPQKIHVPGSLQQEEAWFRTEPAKPTGSGPCTFTASRISAVNSRVSLMPLSASSDAPSIALPGPGQNEHDQAY